MQLFAYSLADSQHACLIWVGIYGTATPPPISFSIYQQPVTATLHSPFSPLGDEVLDAQQRPLNHRALYRIDWPQTAPDNPSLPLTVSAGATDPALQPSTGILLSTTLRHKPLPRTLPSMSDTPFRLLLASCYYQPNDKAMALSQVITQQKLQPDLTLLAGDQVYLDLPSLENLPKARQALAKRFGHKYLQSWFSHAAQPSLGQLLQLAPVVSLPDDHEFWNNYPLFQAQLINTHKTADRRNWQQLAGTLFQQYQATPAMQQGWQRLDIAPLSILLLDSRTERSRQHMLSPACRAALLQWQSDLLAAQQAGQPCIGVLSSGQALLMSKNGWLKSKVADMELPNFADFSLLKSAVETLIRAHIPVIYLTGDVHWGRIVEGKNAQGKILFYEVIASPSRLVATIGADQLSSLRNLFKRQPFPRHPEAEPVPTDFKLADLTFDIKHRQQGDHIAMLQFQQCPGTLAFSVQYVCTDVDARIRQQHSNTYGPYKLHSAQ